MKEHFLNIYSQKLNSQNHFNHVKITVINLNVDFPAFLTRKTSKIDKVTVCNLQTIDLTANAQTLNFQQCSQFPEMIDVIGGGHSNYYAKKSDLSQTHSDTFSLHFERMRDSEM